MPPTTTYCGYWSQLNTPSIEESRIYEVQDPEDAKERFLSTITENARRIFASAWNKVRGIADLREDVIYVPALGKPRREFFAKCYEYAHEVIPWHRVQGTRVYKDDDETLRLDLRPDKKDLFEGEANYFASEIIFQGRRFRERSLSYRPTFDAIFTLANDHGASTHSTLRKFVEEHDEPLLAVPYWPSNYYIDELGHAVLKRGRPIVSESFRTRYADIELPEAITSDHPWASARGEDTHVGDSIHITCGAKQRRFEWQSWWNTYSLLILLRRPPALSIVRSLSHKTC